VAPFLHEVYSAGLLSRHIPSAPNCLSYETLVLRLPTHLAAPSTMCCAGTVYICFFLCSSAWVLVPMWTVCASYADRSDTHALCDLHPLFQGPDSARQPARELFLVCGTLHQ